MGKIDFDFAQAERFIDSFSADGRVTFQTFCDKKDTSQSPGRSLTKVFHGTFEEHKRQLISLNTSGAGIFVTINETDFHGRRTDNIVRVRALFVDLDGAPLEPVLTHCEPPHLVVETSPKRWHAYWLTNDCPLEEFSAAQKHLASQFNGDTSVCDLPRVMRLPGFFHQKDTPFLSQIILPSQS